MKILLIIIGLILSCNVSDGLSIDENLRSGIPCTAVVSADRDSGMGDFDRKSPDMLPFRTAGYSGGSNSLTPPVRSTHSGRGAQDSAKAPFIRDGKIIGIHTVHTFLTNLNQFSSGRHSINRYIYSLCQLLI